MMKGWTLCHRSGTRQGCLLLSFLLNIVLKGLAMEARQQKEKGNPDKKWIKLSLFANDMISYTENLKEYIQKTY